MHTALPNISIQMFLSPMCCQKYPSLTNIQNPWVGKYVNLMYQIFHNFQKESNYAEAIYGPILEINVTYTKLYTNNIR